MHSQAAVDGKNSEFWNVLCGTSDAVALGIVDRSPSSLKIFDDWFFAFYPYLDRHIPFARMRGAKVLEVGLGYGSIGQRIAEAGTDYVGLDIAEGPVEMMNYRLSLLGSNGRAAVGSILQAPLASGSFDYVVAIGCYHHTGDLQQAIDESHRLLRPGGRLIFMVYNGFSYRQWHSDFRGTVRRLLARRLKPFPPAMRAEYDQVDGIPAPHTDFVSRSRLRRMCRAFRSYEARLENITSEPPFRRPRAHLLRSFWPSIVGLDIYATAVK